MTLSKGDSSEGNFELNESYASNRLDFFVTFFVNPDGEGIGEANNKIIISESTKKKSKRKESLKEMLNAQTERKY